MSYEQIRRKVFIRDFFTCQRCGKTGGIHIAHRIKQGIGSEKYIQDYMFNKYNDYKPLSFIREFIINHPLNMVTVCSLKCNDSFNIFFNEVERDELLNKIINTLK